MIRKTGLGYHRWKNSDDGQSVCSHLDKQLIEGWKVEAAISGSPIDLGKALREADDKKEVAACL